jgi:transposase-like protein
MKKQRKIAGGRATERAAGERSEAPPGGAIPTATAAAAPSPELVERAKRRRFTAEYKLEILREAAACTEPGEVGALLRREGLYSSHLATWRALHEQGALGALGRRRGRRKTNPLEAENAVLRRRAERAEAELVKAHKVIEVQGKVSALLGVLLEPNSAPPALPSRSPAP